MHAILLAERLKAAQDAIAPELVLAIDLFKEGYTDTGFGNQVHEQTAALREQGISQTTIDRVGIYLRQLYLAHERQKSFAPLRDWLKVNLNKFSMLAELAGTTKKNLVKFTHGEDPVDCNLNESDLSDLRAAARELGWEK